MPAPGIMVPLSPEFNPPILKGLKVHPDNPFRFDFILDQGSSTVIPAKAGIQTEATKLIKYFLASLTIPEKDLWVNLSPYEKNRIIPNSFGLTEMGRDLLAEDYMLKQITASLIYPEGETGKKFWKRIYQEAAKKFGTTNIPVNTFNKVWIIPEKAVVYENAKAGTAYVVEAKLKVMLEQDYLALEKNIVIQKNPVILSEAKNLKTSKDSSASPQNDVNALGSQIVREIVIPELTKEVNSGRNFAQLRQVYNSLILATWYKKKIKDSILAQVYADKNKVAGIQYASTVIPAKGRIDRHSQLLAGIHSQDNVEFIYQQYLKAFKKGVYNYIKEDQDPLTQQITPRKYFSGGIDWAMSPLEIKNTYIGSVLWRRIMKPVGRNLIIGVMLTIPHQANDFLIGSYLNLIERKIIKGQDVDWYFRGIYGIATRFPLTSDLIGRLLKDALSAEHNSRWARVIVSFVLDHADYLGDEYMEQIVTNHDYGVGIRLRVLRVWSQHNFSKARPLFRKIQGVLLGDKTPESMAISKAIDLMRTQGLFNKDILGTTGAYFMWDDPFVILSDYFNKAGFSELISAMSEDEGNNFYRIVLSLLGLGLTYQEREDILIKGLEPFALKHPEDLTVPVLEDISKVYQEDRNFRYFLYYITTNPRASSLVQQQAEGIIRNRGLFSLHGLIENHLKYGRKNILIIHNIKDGQGDELVRTASLIQGLLGFNPDLEVTVITGRPYLYNHPRVKIIPMQDLARTHWQIDGAREHYDAVIDFYGNTISFNNDLEENFRVSNIGKNAFLNIHAHHADVGSLIFERIRVNGQDYADRLNLDDSVPWEFNIHEVYSRLNAELGLPLKKEGTEFLVNGTPNARFKEQWGHLMEQIGNPLIGHKYKYPVVSLNPYGGGMESKGFSRSKKDQQELVSIIEKLVSNDYKVVLLPNDTPWGTRKIAEELVDQVSKSNRGGIAIAPGPSLNPEMFKYFVSYSNYVLTVEGGMMHLASVMGKPFGVIFKLAGMSSWVPLNRTRLQAAGVQDALLAIQHKEGRNLALEIKPADRAMVIPFERFKYSEKAHELVDPDGNKSVVMSEGQSLILIFNEGPWSGFVFRMINEEERDNKEIENEKQGFVLGLEKGVVPPFAIGTISGHGVIAVTRIKPVDGTKSLHELLSQQQVNRRYLELVQDLFIRLVKNHLELLDAQISSNIVVGYLNGELGAWIVDAELLVPSNKTLKQLSLVYYRKIYDQGGDNWPDGPFTQSILDMLENGIKRDTVPHVENLSKDQEYFVPAGADDQNPEKWGKGDLIKDRADGTVCKIDSFPMRRGDDNKVEKQIHMIRNRQARLIPSLGAEQLFELVSKVKLTENSAQLAAPKDLAMIYKISPKAKTGQEGFLSWAEKREGRSVNMTGMELAKRFKVSREIVNVVCLVYSIKTKGWTTSPNMKKALTWAQKKKSKTTKMTPQQIANKFEVAQTSINVILRVLEIQASSRKSPEPSKEIRKFLKWAKKLHEKNVKSIDKTERQIAKKYNVSNSIVHSVLKALGISTKGSQDISPEMEALLSMAKKKRYKTLKKTINKVARKYGVARSRTSIVLWASHIKPRDGRRKLQPKLDQAMKTSADLMPGVLIADPRKSILVSGKIGQSQIFELGTYQLREDVTPKPGETRKGIIYALENLYSKRYELRFILSSQKKDTDPFSFNNFKYVQVDKDSGDDWQMTNFWPYSRDDGTINRFAKSGGAEVILSYIEQAVNISGRQLKNSGHTAWRVLSWYFYNRLYRNFSWPARVRIEGSEDMNDWISIDDPLVADGFFKKENVGVVQASLGGEAVLISLKKEGKKRYQVEDILGPFNMPIKVDDDIVVDFSTGDIVFQNKKIGRVEILTKKIEVGDFVNLAMVTDKNEGMDRAMKSDDPATERAEDYYDFTKKEDNIQKLEEVLQEVMRPISSHVRPVIVGGRRYFGPGRKDIDVLLEGTNMYQSQLWLDFIQALAKRFNKVKGIQVEILKDEPFFIDGVIQSEALKLVLVSGSGEQAKILLDILLNFNGSDEVQINQLKALLQLDDKTITEAPLADLAKSYFKVEYYIGDRNIYRSMREQYQAGDMLTLESSLRQRMKVLKDLLSKMRYEEIKERIQERLSDSVSDWSMAAGRNEGMDRAMKASAILTPGVLIADPRQSFLVTGKKGVSQVFKFGQYRLRNDVELKPGETRKGFIYAMEYRARNEPYEYELNLYFYSRAQNIRSPSFENFSQGKTVTLVKSQNGDWRMGDFWPYSAHEGTIKRFANSGGAEAALFYIIQAVRISGKQLKNSGWSTWRALSWYFSNRLYRKFPWPARVRIKGSEGMKKWTPIDDPLVADGFFKRENVGDVRASFDGEEVLISLKKVGKQHYQVEGISGPSNKVPIKVNDEIVVEFPTGNIIVLRNKEIGRVEKLTKEIEVGGFADRAMAVGKNEGMGRTMAVKVHRQGGIDFTAGRTPLEVKGDGNGEIQFHLDPTQLAQLQNAPGFVPVIISIQPMTDLRAFLEG